MRQTIKDYGLVSIITPSYNSSLFIVQTIESILAQTYTNWELLITDDCSTDNSVEIIEWYCQKDARIKLFCLKRNGGAGICRNNSIQKARGQFIAFCDSDDYWMPNKLEKQLAFMAKKGCVLSYTSYMTCDENGEMRGIVVCRNTESFFSSKCNNGIGCLTAMYDVRKMGKIFMPTIRKRQDWGLWLIILRKCRVAYGMKEPLAVYRQRSNSISSNKYSLIAYNLNVYRKVLNFSWVKSYFFFFCFFLPNFLIHKTLQSYINR